MEIGVSYTHHMTCPLSSALYMVACLPTAVDNNSRATSLADLTWSWG